MCAVSYIGDYWKREFSDNYPDFYHHITQPAVNSPVDLSKFATKEDIEKLKKDMEELKKLLKAAINYDEATDQPHCEHEDKIDLIKKVAESLGVDLSELNLN